MDYNLVEIRINIEFFKISLDSKIYFLFDLFIVLKLADLWTCRLVDFFFPPCPMLPAPCYSISETTKVLPPTKIRSSLLEAFFAFSNASIGVE